MKLRQIIFMILLQLPLLIYGNKGNQRYDSKSYQCYSDSVVEGKYVSKALSPYIIKSNYANINREWRCKNDISCYPQLESSSLMERAVYNMSFDEMVNAVEPDSTLRTGKEWSGVWTRDVSYSIILAMAYMQPQVSMNSLMKKVTNNGRIIQDTGTGGAWPCSTDRMIWTIAAWEIYKVTGDNDWLKKIYPIINETIDDDFHNIIDKHTGLIKGESSFIDWREQSYPKWMQPADISQSKCLGTNALYARALVIASNISDIMGNRKLSEKYRLESDKIKSAVNKYLWMNDKGYYSQYLYGRDYDLVSSGSETLGEALCILFDIADYKKAKQITQKMPLMEYGAPVFYPFIKDVPPYHNNAIWPFVVSYWMHACAKAENEDAVAMAIGNIYREASMFCTNKENMVADNGSYDGTQINSDNMLWSLSGNISIINRLLFGMRYELDGLEFHPFIPKQMDDRRLLKNVPYRSAIFDIEISGYGNVIKSFTIDGKGSKPVIFPLLRNKHSIRIVMANRFKGKTAGVNLVKNLFILSEPKIKNDKDTLSWDRINGASSYIVIKDGKEFDKTNELYYIIPQNVKGQFQIVASCYNELENSFASEPIDIHSSVQQIRINKEINLNQNRCINAFIGISESKYYMLDFLYSNGSGPIETDNKCAIRSLYIDDEEIGAVLFPQRGLNNWMEKGWSNSFRVFLKKGKHKIEVRMMDWNNNMNFNINHAIIYKLRLKEYCK